VRGRKAMKIALVVWDLSVSGGTQRQALELAHYLQKVGHTVKIYCAYLNRSKCYPERLKGLDIVPMMKGDYLASKAKPRRWLFYPLEPLFTEEAKSFARNMEKGFDIVNPHEHRAYRVAYYYKKLHGTPAVWMVNDLPRSLIVPPPRDIVNYLHYVLLGGPIGRRVDRRRIRDLDGAVVFDKPSMEAFHKRTGIMPARMGSGLDPSAFEFRLGGSCGDKEGVTLLAVGIFFPHRRFEDLLHAVDLLNKEKIRANLLLVGSESYASEYAQKVHDLVRTLGLEGQVKFMGEIPETALRSLYASSDVLVFPNYPQTWGLAVFEAMASGTPVIVSTGAGASEVLTDGENALLVPPGNPQMIAKSIKRLVDDPSLYRKLSVNGRSFVEEKISWDAYGQRMEILFNDAVSRKTMSGVKKG